MPQLDLQPRITYNDKGEKIVEYSDPASRPQSTVVERSVKNANGKAVAMVNGLRKNAPSNLDPFTVLEMALTAVFQLDDRIKELEQREAKSLADSYKGPHLKNAAYLRSDLVTHDGSLWLALADTKELPSHSADWKLIVKGAR